MQGPWSVIVRHASAVIPLSLTEPDAFWTAIIGDFVVLLGVILTIRAASKSLATQLRTEAANRATEQEMEWERRRAERAEERESVARAIGEEVALISAEIHAHHVNREAGLASPSSEIATPIFDAVGYRIGELQATREIAFFYTQVRIVSRVLGDWDSYWHLLERSMRGEIGGGPGLEVKARGAKDSYFTLSRDVMAYAEELIPKLQAQITTPPPLELHSRLADLPRARG